MNTFISLMASTLDGFIYSIIRQYQISFLIRFSASISVYENAAASIILMEMMTK